MTEASEESEPVHLDPSQAVVPPWLVVFVQQIEASGKKVLRTRVTEADGKPVLDDTGRPVLKYNDARAMREFIGLELVPQIVQALSVLSDLTAYTHGIANNASMGVVSVKRWATGHFRALGARELEDDPGLSSETLDTFGNAFFALGTHLKEKYPDDEALSAKWNAAAEAYGKLLEEARTGGDGGDDEDGDEDENEDEE